MTQAQVGDRIYYQGDMANQPGWFVVTGHKEATKYGEACAIMREIETDDDEPREITIGYYMIEDKYAGNGSTRFVTAAAYYAWHKARMEALQEWAARLAAK